MLQNAALGQQSQVPDAPQPQTQPTNSKANEKGPSEYNQHHIFWIIPNYRADEHDFAQFKPLTSHEKLKVAVDDSFDPSAFLVAGIFAGIDIAQNSYRGFGDGAAAAGKYYAAAFADQAIGNMMTEAIFPIGLRQDPRYFVKGKGGFWKRTGYAISREVVTYGDDGKNHFNISELAGNAVAAGISNAYYPAQNRSFGNTMNKYGQQIGLDTFFNVTKEFWPDIRHSLFHTR